MTNSAFFPDAFSRSTSFRLWVFLPAALKPSSTISLPFMLCDQDVLLYSGDGKMFDVSGNVSEIGGPFEFWFFRWARFSGAISRWGGCGWFFLFGRMFLPVRG